MRSMKRQGGFTLIELVVVITILGILAAFAVPRFASLESDARTAATRAMEGSIRSGAAMAHALWLADGTSPTSVMMENQSIAMTEGYPTEVGIVNVLVDTSGFSTTTSGTTVTFAKLSGGGAAISNCQVTYTPPTTLGAAPAIAADISGC